MFRSGAGVVVVVVFVPPSVVVAFVAVAVDELAEVDVGAAEEVTVVVVVVG